MIPKPDHRPVTREELAAHLRRLAAADADDDADRLCDAIERCWDERSLRQ
jgi:hypothetical protein